MNSTPDHAGGGCPRSTLIGFKGGKEVARMSWGMSEDAVLGVLKATL